MGEAKRSGTGLGALAVVALLVCCAGPALISAGVLAAVGTWLRSAVIIAVAGVLAAGAVAYTLYRRRRGAACPPRDADAAARDSERATRSKPA